MTAGSTARTTGEPTSGSPVLLLHRVLLAGLAGLMLLLAWVSLQWPFSWDQGIFAWVGAAIVDGGLPYRDAWDVKGPLTFYVFALVEWLVGPRMWGIRAFDLLLLGLAVTAAARIVRPLAGPGAAAYTALVLALQYTGTGYFETAQPDGWAALLLLPGLAPLMTGAAVTSLRRAFVSACLLGTCLLLKPTYAVFAVAPATYVLLGRDLDGQGRWRGVLVIALGFAVPALLCAAWFAAQGALSTLVDTYIRFNLEQAGAPLPGLDTSPAGALRRFAWRLLRQPAVMVEIVLALAAVAVLRPYRPRELAVLTLVTGAAFFSVYVQQRYWNRYQWHPAYLSLGVLAGTGLGCLWHRPRPGAGRIAGRPAAALLGATLLATVLPAPVREVGDWIALRRGRLSDAEYNARFRHPALSWTIADARALAEHVRDHTAPDDRVLVWSDPLVNYLSRRPSVGRFGFHVPVAGTAAATPQVVRNQQEMLREIARTPPRYFAVGRRNLEKADSLNEASLAHRFPALLAVLRADYVPVARFGEMELYERRREPSSP